MQILGISGFYHDSAASLVCDGHVVAAAQEERFTRRKHDPRFPHYAMEYCLKEGGAKLSDMDYVVFYDKPFLKFERLLETYSSYAPRGFQSFRQAMPVWIKEKLFQKDLLIKELSRHGDLPDLDKKLLFTEHHMSHAASAFYPSPFSEAAVLTMDGVGEWATTSFAIGKGSNLEVLKEIHFPHSLGLLYSAFTYYCGFRVNSGEYKLMGLAPYGVPRFKEQILESLIDVKADGSFQLQMQYFNYCTGLTMTSELFHELFEGPPRNPEDTLSQKHMDLASSIQAVTEEVVIKMARAIAKESKCANLCLAGGVALNCVGNGRLLREKIFERIWIQPAAGDAGGALGAALTAYHKLAKGDRLPADPSGDHMKGSFLGPRFEQSDVERRLKEAGAKFTVLNDDDIFRESVSALSDEKAVGWFQGRMEFGPRALGGRSIIGDPRSKTMQSVQSVLNLKVKYRESFRPFAPIVLEEDASDWFDIVGESPYMLLVAPVSEEQHIPLTDKDRAVLEGDPDLLKRVNIPRSTIPAVTHVDYSARIQTIDQARNPKTYQLLKAFKAVSGCPVLVNTSFNVRGEPIVCTPEDAFRCFMGTGIEVLVIENCFLRKEDQDPSLKLNYESSFELD